MALPINVEDLLRQRKVEDRLSFLVRIPCHEGEEGISRAFMSAEANDKETNNHDKENDKETPKETREITKETLNGTINDTINRDNAPLNGVNDTNNPGTDTTNDTINDSYDTINDTINPSTETTPDTIKGQNDKLIQLNNTQLKVYGAIQVNPSITRIEMTKLLNISTASIGRAIEVLRNKGLIERKGSKKSGVWILK